MSKDYYDPRMFSFDDQGNLVRLDPTRPPTGPVQSRTIVGYAHSTPQTASKVANLAAALLAAEARGRAAGLAEAAEVAKTAAIAATGRLQSSSPLSSPAPRR